MFRELAPTDQTNKLAEIDPRLQAMGQAANQAAAVNIFADYRRRKAENTLRRQDRDLALFAEFLQAYFDKVNKGNKKEVVGDLANDPSAWSGITWGLVAAFQKWLLAEGYAVSTVNVRMSTVKRYAKLAFQAGALPPQEAALIFELEGYSRKEIKRLDDQREARDVPTRKGNKKAQFNTITRDQAKELISALPDKPQGRRDRLLVLLMFEHGLRIGEVESLERSNFDLRSGTLTFYRPKVDKTQSLNLGNTPRTLEAAKAYIRKDAPKDGLIWRGSNKAKGTTHDAPGHGDLSGQGFKLRAMRERINLLGRVILEIPDLSPHDLRHSWATIQANNGTPLHVLMEWGGWSSPAMPMRYIEAAKFANTGAADGGDPWWSGNGE